MIVLTVLPPVVKVKITAVDRLVPLVGIPSREWGTPPSWQTRKEFAQ
jgi:hypothetical protein